MNPTQLTVHEILTTISGDLRRLPYKHHPNRVEFLKKNESFELKSVLQGAFNEKVQFNLPTGTPPPFKKGTPLPFKNSISAFAGLLQEKKTMLREGAFLKILGSCTDEEAKILIAIKDKRLNDLYKGITLEIASAAFPKLFGN